VGRGLDVRDGLGSCEGRSRCRLPALRHGRSLDLQRRHGLRLGLRLLLGLGAVPLRSLGPIARARLGVDSGSSLRGRMGYVAHGARRLRLRRLGADAAGLVLGRRRGGRLVVRLVSPPRSLCVLCTRSLLLRDRVDLHGSGSERSRALRTDPGLCSRAAGCRRWRTSPCESEREWRWRSRRREPIRWRHAARSGEAGRRAGPTS
jgi:hypothetical protein